MNIMSPIINANIPHSTYFPVVIASKNSEISISDKIVEIQIILLKAFSEITYLSFSSKISTENSALGISISYSLLTGLSSFNFLKYKWPAIPDIMKAACPYPGSPAAVAAQTAYNIVSHMVTIIELYKSMTTGNLDFTFHGNCFYRAGESTEGTTYTSIS